MFGRVVVVLFGSTLLTTAAEAACLVDSVESVVVERTGTRTDHIRFFVESGRPDCAWLRLTTPGGGEVLSAEAKVLRGDTKNAAFGPQHLARVPSDGEIAAYYAIPGLRTGDIIALTVERRITAHHRWTPDAWGAPGWASLKWKGPAEPTEANIPSNGKEWFIERAAVEAAGGGVFVQFGDVAKPSPTATHTGTATVDIELRPEPSPPPGEPPFGETRTEWHIPIGPSGTHTIAWPAGATDRLCQAEWSPEALVIPTDHGCTISEAGEGARLVAAWTLPRLQLAGELGPGRRSSPGYSAWTGPADTGPLPHTGTVGGVGPIDVTVRGMGVSFRGQVRSAERTRAQTGESRLTFTVPGTITTDPHGIPPHAGWWVTAVHGQPLLANRVALVDAVDRTALAASVPEPGLPARIRMRSGDPDMIPEIQALVREQVRHGEMAGTRSLQPRRLTHARASTHATEWELALITARYLRQIRLDAVPIPVRPVHIGPSDPGMPAGFDHAVVRVRLATPTADGTDTLWLDPACAVCAPGELRPFLWGADTLSDVLPTLPDAPAGQRIERIEVTPDGNEHVTVTYSGTAALSLRLGLLDLPADTRLAALDQQHGGKISKHTGLGDQGAPIELHLDRPGVLDPPPPTDRIPLPAAEHIRIDWVGDRIREVRVSSTVAEVLLAPAGSVELDGTGLSWERTLGVEADGTRVALETLRYGEPIVSRASIEALRSRISAAPPAPLDVPKE